MFDGRPVVARRVHVPRRPEPGRQGPQAGTPCRREEPIEPPRSPLYRRGAPALPLTPDRLTYTADAAPGHGTISITLTGTRTDWRCPAP
ncbi:MAG: hypothetical protein AVDCRST_MAG49-1976 [uncultured Thermomicrobiales bacterium]|uniref:Uncharacterized protein n=1 Tax=uncultured Thermomicrobiales bacterium TaxID=1645740 RepID=A0A6J4UNF2_9BACT|nr:MAG: hypothetical protein AVDCRST_MAG49-1976 [uncultured Thermomicrobiales bacterium]